MNPKLTKMIAGQISGFLAMKDFQQRFGQLQSDGTYAFSNVRSGLIVGLVIFSKWAHNRLC